MTNTIENIRNEFNSIREMAKEIASKHNVNVSVIQGNIVFSTSFTNEVGKSQIIAAKGELANWLLTECTNRKWNNKAVKGFRVWNMFSDYSDIRIGIACGIKAVLTEEERSYARLGQSF